MAEKEKSFEEALAELEQLVREMESGKLPLESMIGKFESGSRLVALCRAKLDAMSHKIELLVKDDGQSGEWRDFDPASERSAAALKTPEQAPAVEAGELPF